LASVGWRALVACEAWDLAADAIDALPEPERDRTPARLGRMRVAVGRCTKPEGAIALEHAKKLEGREDAAPVRATIARLEIDANVCAEKWKEALDAPSPHGLRARTGAVASRTLARALEATGDVAGARAALTKAIEGAPKAGLPLGALLVWRLRLERTAGDEASAEADRKRLFVELPASFEAAVAGGESSTQPKLDVDAWLKRAESLAGLGRADDAIKAIDEAATLGAPARKVARAKGHVLYVAKSYTRAAIALAEAAKLGPPGGDGESIDDEFHAARATSRGGNDTTAIVAYDKIAKEHPGSRFGIEASFLAAQLRFLHGHWTDALAAMDRYLAGPAKLGGQENNAREMKRMRALALLEVGRLAEARTAFRTLAKSDAYEKDSFAQGRLDLLAAIASERMGEKADAIKTYDHLSSAHPYGWLEIASKARLAKLGETRTPFPKGPVSAPAGVTLAPPHSILHDAGLDRDALTQFLADTKAPKLESERCAAFFSLNAGAESYRLGLRLGSGVSASPDSTNGWSWRCAYPSPYDDVVAALEAREGLPRGLLHAIVRQESAFLIEVVSPAGAIGIAQLMPFTAVATASKIGVTLDPTDVARIQSPFLQLDLAARHLHDLYAELAPKDAQKDASDEKKRATSALVIAAYNAGAGAVKRWLGEAATLDADIFVERIPFLETRGYTARVLGNLLRYSIMAGTPQPILPPKFSAPL